MSLSTMGSSSTVSSSPSFKFSDLRSSILTPSGDVLCSSLSSSLVWRSETDVGAFFVGFGLLVFAARAVSFRFSMSSESSSSFLLFLVCDLFSFFFPMGLFGFSFCERRAKRAEERSDDALV